MSSDAIIHRGLARSVLAGLAVAMASCGAPSQKMDMAPDLIATPPHRMSRFEYPFDASGRYMDAWAAEGAGRYGRFINTDRSEDGRSDTAELERRPLPSPRPATATTRPPSSSQPKKSTATPPAPKKAAPSKPPATKTPVAKKPAPKKKPTTHTVKRGDSLSSLSRRYGVSIQALKKANNLKSDRIIDGRTLVVPRK